MVQRKVSPDTGSGKDNAAGHDNVAQEVDQYMASVDLMIAKRGHTSQVCPYHNHLITQANTSAQSKCCVLQTWLDEGGHQQSAIVCLTSGQGLSTTRPCTCASLLGMEVQISSVQGSSNNAAQKGT